MKFAYWIVTLSASILIATIFIAQHLKAKWLEQTVELRSNLKADRGAYDKEKDANITLKRKLVALRREQMTDHEEIGMDDE